MMIKKMNFIWKKKSKEYLTVEKVDFKIENVSGYSNSAYDSNFLAVTWIENNELNFIYVVAGRILTLVNKND